MSGYKWADANNWALQKLGGLDNSSGRSTTNYQIVQARHAKEDRLRRERDKFNTNTATATATTSNQATATATARASFYGTKGVTFRDAVEDVAWQYGIPFYPEGSGGGGGGGFADGKVVFVMGEE